MNPVRIYVLTAFTVPPPVPKSQQQILVCRHICLFETFLVVAQEAKMRHAHQAAAKEVPGHLPIRPVFPHSKHRGSSNGSKPIGL